MMSMRPSVPLDGIRIVDFTRYLPGPYATLRLGELGAQVIHVEPPGGDPARHLGEKVGGLGVVYAAHRRGKQSVMLDLKQHDDREKAWEMVKEADVVIESFRPGVANDLGIGYNRLKEIKPDLIYCSMSGYGQNTELSTHGGHDLNYLAYSGILSLHRDPSGQPVHPQVQWADLVGGMAASEAIVAGLVQRLRTGQGSHIDLSLTDTMVGLLTHAILYQSALSLPQGSPLLNGTLVCYAIYPTADHQFVTMGALEGKFWSNFCEAVGHPEWIDEQFSATDHGNPVFLQVQALFASRTLKHWADFAKKIDCCMAPVLDLKAVLEATHFQAGRITEDGQVRTSTGGR